MVNYYILDNEEANKIRIENKTKETDVVLREETLNDLDSYLRKHNPYAQAYKLMHEVEKSTTKNYNQENIPNIRIF